MGRVKCDVSGTLTSLDSVVAASTERVDAQSDLTLPCYCSAAAKNHSACTELLSGPVLPTERMYARFELKLPRHRSAATISRFFCTELLDLLLVLLTLGRSESLWVVLSVTCVAL